MFGVVMIEEMGEYVYFYVEIVSDCKINQQNANQQLLDKM